MSKPCNQLKVNSNSSGNNISCEEKLVAAGRLFGSFVRILLVITNDTSSNEIAQKKNGFYMRIISSQTFCFM